jgi:hypothetical protein
MSEAEVRLLARIRDEVDAVVGPRVAVIEVRRTVGPIGVQLVADCETPIGPWQIEADGATVVDATGRLIDRATHDRLVIAFREVTTPT